MVGGHHQQQRVFVVLCRHAGRKRHRGRRVAADGLEQDARPYADGRHLLGDQEPVRLVADHQALGRRARHAVHAGRCLLQHGCLTDQRQQLLGVHRARRGPEARPGAPGQDDGKDVCHAQPRCNGYLLVCDAGVRREKPGLDPASADGVILQAERLDDQGVVEVTAIEHGAVG